MGIRSRFGTSATLTQGMAERLGADLPAVIEQDPEYAARAFRSAVLRCMRCTDQNACAHLQAENATLDHAPDYCRNRWG